MPATRSWAPVTMTDSCGTAGPATMGYWAPADLPFYSGLARTFPLADRWFASCLGPTHPNRRFLIAGTSGGLVHNRHPISTDPPPANGTIFNLLERYRPVWRNYYLTTPTAGLFMSAVAQQKANLVPVEQFFDDANRVHCPTSPSSTRTTATAPRKAPWTCPSARRSRPA